MLIQNTQANVLTSHNSNCPNNLNPSNNLGTTNNQINTNSNNINSYHNLMMDSLLLRSSESFSIDRNNIKNMTLFNEGQSQRDRVLSFNSSNLNTTNIPSKNPKNFLNQIKSMVESKSLNESYFLNNKSTSLMYRLKEINSSPERILDAPNLVDDFYLNLIDWSSQNVLAVALGPSVYLWNGNTFETTQLMTTNENICSLNWINTGNCLAVGMKGGNIELWDTNKLQQIRDMDGHSDRVCSLSWNNYILSSGSKDTKIINHDVRVRNHKFQYLLRHTQEVCSLKWSPDGSLLASGGNDNLLCIWDVNNYTSNNNDNGALLRARSSSANVPGNNFSNILNNPGGNFLLGNGMINEPFSLNNNLNHNFSQGRDQNSIWNIIEGNEFNNNNNQNNINGIMTVNPKYVFTNHEAAVKALAWCPWQKGLLASGAGSKDKSIKFWNVDAGCLVNSIDSGSQVCSLIWNKHEKELISSHGFSKNQISFWKYPSMCKITELSGHMSRVLYLSMSPDGCSIVSGAGDETLRFWKIHDSKKLTNETVDYNLMGGFQVR
jgi:cell division cycle 20-like protein 1 (cofactor of APC complex)